MGNSRFYLVGVLLLVLAGAVGYFLVSGSRARAEFVRAMDAVRLQVVDGQAAPKIDAAVAELVSPASRPALAEAIAGGDPADVACAVFALDRWIATGGPEDDAARAWLNRSLSACATAVEASGGEGALGPVALELAAKLLGQAGARGEFADRCWAVRAGAARAPRVIADVSFDKGGADVALSWEPYPGATYYQVAVNPAGESPYAGQGAGQERDPMETFLTVQVLGTETSWRALLDDAELRGGVSIEEVRGRIEQIMMMENLDFDAPFHLVLWVQAFKGDPKDYQVTDVLEKAHARFVLRLREP